MTVTIDIEGMDETIRQLTKAGEAVAKVTEDAVLAGADLVVDQAVSKGPGDGIDKEVSQKKGTQVVVDIGPNSEKWYYRFIESGAVAHQIRRGPRALQVLVDEWRNYVASHPGTQSQPFLQPALERNVDAIADRVGAVFKAALDRVTYG